MTVLFDFKMNYKLTIELDGGAQLQKTYDNFGNFNRMFHHIQYLLETDGLNSIVELPGQCSVRLRNIRGLKGEYVEIPVN